MIPAPNHFSQAENQGIIADASFFSPIVPYPIWFNVLSFYVWNSSYVNSLFSIPATFILVQINIISCLNDYNPFLIVRVYL